MGKINYDEIAAKRNARRDQIRANTTQSNQVRKELEGKLESIRSKVDNEIAVKNSIEDTVSKVMSAAQKYTTPVTSDIKTVQENLAEQALQNMNESPAPTMNQGLAQSPDTVVVDSVIFNMLLDEIKSLKEMVGVLTNSVNTISKAQLISNAVTPKRHTVQQFDIMKPNGKVDEPDGIDTHTAMKLLKDGNIRDIYGNISIAVVTGDMITDSERLDDPNSDGGAKYFDDLYMAMLKRQDSKNYLIDILKSRVDRSVSSPVDRLAKEVKQQHDVEKILLLKMQLDDLQKQVFEKAGRKD